MSKKKGIEDQKQGYLSMKKEYDKYLKNKSLTEDHNRLQMEYVLARKLDNKTEQDAKKIEIEKKQTIVNNALEKLKSLNAQSSCWRNSAAEARSGDEGG